MNKIFPYWEDANDLLPGIIDRSYGIKILRGSNNIQMNILNINPDDSKLIPNQYKSRFIHLSTRFMGGLFRKIKFNPHRYEYKFLDDEQLIKVKDEFERALYKYEADNHISVKQELLKTLGYTSSVELKFELKGM